MRHHANDGIRMTFDIKGAPEHGLVRIEVLAPEAVANDGDMMACGLFAVDEGTS